MSISTPPKRSTAREATFQMSSTRVRSVTQWSVSAPVFSLISAAVFEHLPVAASDHDARPLGGELHRRGQAKALARSRHPSAQSKIHR